MKTAVLAHENPFATERLVGLPYQNQSVDIDELLIRLERRNYRGAVVGPRGVGKTTLLAEMARELRRRDWNVHSAFLNDRQRRLASIAKDFVEAVVPGRRLLIVDGAEQLSAWSWWRLTRRSRSLGGLIISTHRPTRLPTLCELRPALSTLDRLLAALGPAAQEHSELAQARFAHHHGDLHRVFADLYRHCAGL